MDGSMSMLSCLYIFLHHTSSSMAADATELLSVIWLRNLPSSVKGYPCRLLQRSAKFALLGCYAWLDANSAADSVNMSLHSMCSRRLRWKLIKLSDCNRCWDFRKCLLYLYDVSLNSY